eukprot:TRINITY_DN7329_c0_g4_i1.p1 TRINITY_DN7329_c0_g4~~TRINITY_DN7329_c0_g4_i1.p1  ORF type:complete len:1531 (-),score=381.70 TRINITY_DN7329_c0_g4_i1:513-5105(-)
MIPKRSTPVQVISSPMEPMNTIKGSATAWLDSNLGSVEGAPAVKPKNQPGIEEVQFNVDEERRQLTADDEDIALLTVDQAIFLEFSILGEIAFWFLCLATGGFFWLFCQWIRSLEARIRYTTVASNSMRADYVLATSIDGYQDICPILSVDPESDKPKWVSISAVRHLSSSSDAFAFPLPRMFEWRHERFWFNLDAKKWLRRQYNVNHPVPVLNQLIAKCAMNTWDEINNQSTPDAPLGNLFRSNLPFSTFTRNLTYGENIIDIQPKPLIVLIKDEAIKPFFIFQVFSLIVWFFQDYVIYAYTILGLSTISVLYTAYVTWVNQRNLQKIARSEVPVTKLVLSNKEANVVTSPEVPTRVLHTSGPEKTRPWAPVPTFRREIVSSATLTPGDLIEVTNEMIIPCDMVLVSGGVIINEAMLTGESAPVQKASIPYNLGEQISSDPSTYFRFGSDRDTKYVLFSGTKVVQSKPQSGIICNPIIRQQAGSTALEYGQGETVWQFSSDQSAESLRTYLRSSGKSEAEIDMAVRNFLSTFRSRERSLPVMGMVVKTGFNTAKGKLIRAILYPKPSKFDFDQQMLKFMCILIAATAAGCLATVGFYEEQNISGLDTLLSCLNIITVAIPPALPLALSVALSTTFLELQTKKIFCINPNRIVPAGRVNTLCFDKTGTLTEDGLTLKGVHSLCAKDETDLVHDGNPKSKAMLQSVTLANSENDLVDVYQFVASHRLKNYLFENRSSTMTRNGLISASRAGMAHIVAACHSLAILEEEDVEDDVVPISVDNEKQHLEGSPKKEGAESEEFVGDPLEVQMFAQSGWRFDTRSSAKRKAGSFGVNAWADPLLPSSVDSIMIPPQIQGADEALAIVRRFDFDSTLRRMSCIVYHTPLTTATHDDARFSVLVKGAPESIRDLCQEFSVPPDYDQVLHNLTLSGYRVLACAYKPFLASQVVDGETTGLSKKDLIDGATRYITSSNRTDIESNLYFAGFLVMENPLKKPTIHYLEQYTRAGLRCIMVTGDNPLTAAAVSKQCDPFFLRPSRRTVLLDLVKKPGQEGELVIRDILNPEISTSFFAFLREKKNQNQLKINLGKDAELVDAYAATVPAELSADLDLVVTGAAFQKLLVTHQEFLKEQRQKSSSGQDGGKKVNIELTPLHVVLTRANIFARMSPQNKQELMTALQDISLVVCMTGDGANDSGALKSADVGLSIRANDNQSDEAAANSAPSIAAPFSTSYSHIGAVSILLSEGRACLVSSFAMFRFMFCYGVIQFTAVLVLYRIGNELYDFQYLWSDLGLVFPLAIVMPTIKAKAHLSRGRPESDLFSPSVFRSVFGLGAILVVFQIGANALLQDSNEYEELPEDGDTMVNLDSSESFTFSNFQYTAVGVAVSQNFGVFREPLYRSYILCLVFIAQFVINSIMLIDPDENFEDAFGLVPPSKSTRWRLWVMAVANSFCFILYERFCVPHQSPDEEPFDVEEVVKQIKPRESQREQVVEGEDEPDFQPSLLPKMRWATPHYTVIQSVSSPIWSALSGPNELVK